MVKRFVLLIALLIVAFTGRAQNDIQVTATAPSVVEVGESFRLVYSVNAKADAISGVQLDGFSIMGPSTSYSSSSSWVNGKMSSSVEYSYTYIATPDKEGTFTMPVATVKVRARSINPTVYRYRLLLLPPEVVAVEQLKVPEQSRELAQLNPRP